MDLSAVRRSWWMASLAVLLCTGGVWAQASFSEGFDNNGAVAQGQYGPANLIAKGWIFRMQSSPASSEAFFDGHQGSGSTSTGIPEVRLRVIAADLRFQNSGDTVPISILPGVESACYADCDQNGGLDKEDQTCFKEAYERGCFTKPKPRGFAGRPPGV